MPQPDATQDSTSGPTYAVVPTSVPRQPESGLVEGSRGSLHTRGTGGFPEVCLRARPPAQTKGPGLRWVTTTLTDHHVEDTLPRYQAWEAEATAAVIIDVMDNHTGIRYPALEGHTTVAARGLLVVVACALQHLG